MSLFQAGHILALQSGEYNLKLESNCRSLKQNVNASVPGKNLLCHSAVALSMVSSTLY